MKQTLSRTERNRRAMNGLPMNAPRPLIRKNSDRKPMLDLDAMDEAAELELARKAQLEAREKSRIEHEAAVKLEEENRHQAERSLAEQPAKAADAAAPVKAKPVPVKAKPKRKKA